MLTSKDAQDTSSSKNCKTFLNNGTDEMYDSISINTFLNSGGIYTKLLTIVLSKGQREIFSVCAVNFYNV